MKAVVFYESDPGAMAQVPAHMPAHRARWHEFGRRGDLLMIGPFANPQDDGAMAVFTTRAGSLHDHGIHSCWDNGRRP
ncbi:MAG: hypothetical protein ABSB76_02825 [Streptosporangiaceae bacterium]|jgi:uncharacterized protein YciI